MKKTVVAIIALLIVGAWIYLLWPRVGPGPEELMELVELRISAENCESGNRWDEALQKWQDLLNNTKARMDNTGNPTSGDLQAFVSVAESGIKRCNNLKTPIPSGPILLDPPKQAPTQIAAEEFKKFYPAGKNVRALATNRVQGFGKNNLFIIRSECYFVFRHDFLTETSIESNDGDVCTAVLNVPLAEEVRVSSDHRLALRSDELKWLPIAITVADTYLKKTSKVYVFLRYLFKLSPLTPEETGRWVKLLDDRWGIPIDSSKTNFEFTQRVKDLQGTKIRITFKRGVGVTQFEILEQGTAALDEIKKLAQKSGLMIDFIFGKVNSIKPGESFEIPMREIERATWFDIDVLLDGALRFERIPDAEDLQQAVLKDGTVTIQSHDTSAEIKALEGKAKYSLSGLFLKEAQIKWTGKLEWLPAGHLLLGTEQARELTVESHYLAEQISSNTDSK